MTKRQQKSPMDAPAIILSALVLSAIGAVYYNMMPLYMGMAQDYRQLDNRAIGFLSSAFFLGYNIATSSAFFWIRRWNWRWIAVIGTPLAALSLYAGTLTDNYSLLLLSTVCAGAAFSAIYGVGTTILGDTSNPARWLGLKIAAEGFFGALLFLILPATAIAKWGFDGMVVGIIVAMILLSPALFWLPASGAKGSHEEALTDASEPSENTHLPGIWLTLLGTLIFFTGASALWAFTERIGTVVGFDAATIGTLLSVTLVFATSGSLLAAAMADRFGNLKPFLAGAAGFLLAMVFLHSAQHFHYYAIGACLLTFVIGLALPYAVAEIAELDKDGRFIVLSVPAIGTGAMLGPGIAGVLAKGTDFAPILVFGAIAIVLSAWLFTIAYFAALAKTEERGGEQPNHAN